MAKNFAPRTDHDTDGSV